MQYKLKVIQVTNRNPLVMKNKDNIKINIKMNFKRIINIKMNINRIPNLKRAN